jgi:hypothetical protein
LAKRDDVSRYDHIVANLSAARFAHKEKPDRIGEMDLRVVITGPQSAICYRQEPRIAEVSVHRQRERHQSGLLAPVSQERGRRGSFVNFDDPRERREWLQRLQASARGRARKAGMSFTLPSEYTVKLDRDQDGQCAVTGIKFNLERFADALVKHPFAPSVDRRLSSGGYTEDNVRLVCVAVNFGMGQWGEDVFLRLARAAVDYQAIITPTSDAEWYARQLGRIAIAEDLLSKQPEAERPKQRKVIAGLKSALAKGPARLSQIAIAAGATRRARRPAAAVD